jgi:glucokinase
MSDASISAKPHYLVGDIGGTNARFAYVTPEQAQPQSLAKYRGGRLSEL